MSALSANGERSILEEIGRLDASTATRGTREASTDSAFVSNLASADLEELAHIFARAFLRFEQAREKQNAQNEMDAFANDEQLSSPCEPSPEGVGGRAGSVERVAGVGGAQRGPGCVESAGEARTAEGGRDRVGAAHAAARGDVPMGRAFVVRD